MAPNIPINLIRSYGGLFHFMPRIGARHDFHEQRRHPGNFPETGMIYTYERTAGHHSEDWKP